MISRSTSLPGVLLIEPDVHEDARGWFLESWNSRMMLQLGIEAPFVQDNHSHSNARVLRGLHYQIHKPQGKLVRVVSGEIFDVAVDLRRSSSAFGKWTAARLSAANHRMIWVPPGCAHGFLVLSASADVVYKVTDYYSPEDERVLLWSDPDLAIDWPTGLLPVVSTRDASGARLGNAEVYP